ncbi:MAG TPA: hypothetical protein VM597_07455 [Gemmataceae bacterium]|nr:hypothetical protein [Gemmataceae bacterium]
MTQLTDARGTRAVLLGEVTLGDLLRFSVDTAGMYRECQARQKALSEWVTK